MIQKSPLFSDSIYLPFKGHKRKNVLYFMKDGGGIKPLFVFYFKFLFDCTNVSNSKLLPKVRRKYNPAYNFPDYESKISIPT